MAARYPFPRLHEDRHLHPSTCVVWGRPEIRQSSITKTGMIKKWKVTPVSTRPRTRNNSGGDIIRYHQHIRSKDDTAASNYTTSEKIDIRPKKPRRHTTGGTKQTQEDILIAKHLTSEMENGGKIINEYGQEIDPNSTLGRKQLISMLKQRYGQDIENYRNSNDIGEKERMRRERQKERDRRHEQRMHQAEEREVDHRYIQNGVITNGNGYMRRGSGGSAASCTSEGSEGSPGSPPAVTSHKILRKSMSASHSRQLSSDEEHDQMRLRQRAQHSSNEQSKKGSAKEVVFLQYRDEMKRVNLPPTISSLDAVKVLFINAFPGTISMPHFENQEKSIYIKDMETGVYFQLEDINDIVNRSFLKIHEKEVVQERQYAESLPDFELRRTTSGSSLRSDSILARPTYLNQNSASSPSTHTTPTTPVTKITSETTNKNNSQTTIKVNQNTVKATPIGTTSTTATNESVNSVSKLDESLDKALNTSVHDQLDDLTELLKTALHDEEEHADLMYDIVDTKNPGKINKQVINSLQHKMEESAKKTSLPKHFQPTVIVKAQQEYERNSPLPRKLSTESNPPPASPVKKEEQPTIKKSSVKVTIRSTSSAPSTHVKSPPETSPKPHRVTEDFFEPANRKPYVEHKTIAQSTHKFDMSQLDDIVKESPKSPRKAIPESKNAEQVESDLLEQLQNMEEEMKEFSNNLENSQSPSSSSKANASFSYATVKKSASSSSSIPESPRTPRSRGGSNASFSSHSDAAAEFEKLKTMSIHDQSKSDMSPSSTNKFSSQLSRDNNKYGSSNGSSMKTRMTSTSSSDTTDGVFVTETTSTARQGETFSRTSSFGSSAKLKPTRQICSKPSSVSAPDFSELEKAADKVKVSLKELREELSTMRKAHLDNTRNFKNDIQKKLLEFRKKAFRVDECLKSRIDQNNNNVFANDHPVREQRHRLTDDQVQYGKKVSSAEYRLQSLETSMENVRLDVVGKKRVENPSQLVEFQEELTTVTRNVTEIRNKYHGMEDALQRVTRMELEVIEKERQFMKDEPEKLDILVTRCKTLSGTLETLQKLAKMQQEVTQKKSYPDYQEILDVNESSKSRVYFKR